MIDEHWASILEVPTSAQAQQKGCPVHLTITPTFRRRAKGRRDGEANGASDRFVKVIERRRMSEAYIKPRSARSQDCQSLRFLWGAKAESRRMAWLPKPPT